MSQLTYKGREAWFLKVEEMTDDRCLWQMKGGKSFAEREMIANEVKRESTARGGLLHGTDRN